MSFKHKEIFDTEIVTAGAAHAADPPGVHDFDGRCRKEHEAQFGRAARRAPGARFVLDDAVANCPDAVGDPAAVAAATTDTIAAIDDARPSRGINRARDNRVTSGNFARRGLAQAAHQQAAHPMHRRTPSGRAIGS